MSVVRMSILFKNLNSLTHLPSKESKEFLARKSNSSSNIDICNAVIHIGDMCDVYYKLSFLENNKVVLVISNNTNGIFKRWRCKVFNDYESAVKYIDNVVNKVIDDISRQLQDDTSVSQTPLKIYDKPLFCILGESCSGKDTTVSETINKLGGKAKAVCSYTTRPKRENETEAVDHYFVTKEEFDKIKKENEQNVLAYTKIGEHGYEYMALINELDTSNIYIINPNGM